MDENKRIVEINGVKLEVDLRQAKVLNNLKVGDAVKLLRPEYSDNMKVYPGVVVGFEEFQQLPTIVVAYLKSEYSGVSLDFFYFNSASKNCELVPAIDHYHMFEKDKVVESMDRAIAAAELAVEELERKKSYFLMHFERYFEGNKVTI